MKDWPWTSQRFHVNALDCQSSRLASVTRRKRKRCASTRRLTQHVKLETLALVMGMQSLRTYLQRQRKQNRKKAPLAPCCIGSNRFEPRACTSVIVATGILQWIVFFTNAIGAIGACVVHALFPRLVGAQALTQVAAKVCE